ncbi:uncharacterized protein LOC135484181 [Lineus longissimus]|uniref:uncharacterized protein LOC135484181 n=1 Tax=Lineus longissimus TaxID=88925 RepID=UPI002B4D701B
MKLFLFLVGLCLAIATCNAWFMAPREKVPAAAEIDEQCVALARAGSCDMYDCMAQRHQCDILLKAAKPMCVTMEQKRGQFNHQGKLWLNATRPCLQEALILEYKKTEHNCDDLKDMIKEKSSHCAINVQPSVCDIFEANTGVLVSSQNSELGDSSAVMRKCGWTVFTSYLRYMRESG